MNRVFERAGKDSDSSNGLSVRFCMLLVARYTYRRR